MKNAFFAIGLLASFSALGQTAADSAQVFLRQGQQAMADRRFMVASQSFKKSLQFDSSGKEALRGLGSSMEEMKRYDEAKVAYMKLAGLDPQDSMVLGHLSLLACWTRKWDDAITYARKVEQAKWPGYPTNYILGKSYYELEDYGQSFKYLQAAAREDSANAEIPYMVGRSFVEMSNYKAAAPFLERAVRLDSSRANWAYECALNFAAIPDDRNAIRYYLLAAERGYRTDNDYYENLSVSYQGLGQMDKCIDLLKKVLEKKPADLDLLYSLAQIYFKIGKYQDAIDTWDKILYYDKSNAKALYMIGLSYQKKGDKQKGMQLCDEAIKMDPSLQKLKTQKNLLNN